MIITKLWIIEPLFAARIVAQAEESRSVGLFLRVEISPFWGHLTKVSGQASLPAAGVNGTLNLTRVYSDRQFESDPPGVVAVLPGVREERRSDLFVLLRVCLRHRRPGRSRRVRDMARPSSRGCERSCPPISGSFRFQSASFGELEARGVLVHRGVQIGRGSH
jgi:hypothetical protein